MTTNTRISSLTTASNGASFWEDESHYLHDTLVEAERIWRQDKDDFNHLMQWIYSMHRLAEYYQKQSNHTQAFYYLITPHNWVIQSLHDTSNSEEEVITTLHALKVTLEPLYAFSFAHRCCDDCHQNLEETRALLQQRALSIH